MHRLRHLRHVCLAVVFVVMAAAPALAQSQQLKATVDRDQLGAGDAAQLYLTFEGTQDIPAPSLSLPQGLTSRYVGPTSRMSVVNGQTTSSVTHRYLLIPQQAGSFRVGPFHFTIHGTTYTAPAITLEVVAAGTPVSAAAATEGGPPAGRLEDRIFVTLETKKNTLYLNEKALLTVKLYVNQVAIRDANFPVFENAGFTMERIGTPRQYQINKNDLLYNILEFNLLFFPTRTGDLTLGPARVQCTQLISRKNNNFPDEFFSSFFGAQETHGLELASNALPITVLPFPEEGRPVDFKGAVGQFTLNAQIAPGRVALGDPVTLTMKVTGDGNLKTVSTPVLAGMQGFKTYDAQRTETEREVAFEQVLVPRDADLTQIPAVGFTYFDPSTRRYKTARAGPFPLEVLASGSPGATKVVESKEAAAQPRAPEELGSDIIYIKEDPGRWQSPQARLYRHPVVAVFLAVPLLILLGLWSWSEHQYRLSTDTAYARRLRASPKAQKGYRQAAADMAAGRHQEFYAGVSRTLREFLADKCRASAPAITAASLDSLPGCDRLDENGIKTIKDLLTKSDDIRYASLAASPDEMKEDLALLRQALDRIEKIHA